MLISAVSGLKKSFDLELKLKSIFLQKAKTKFTLRRKRKNSKHCMSHKWALSNITVSMSVLSITLILEIKKNWFIPLSNCLFFYKYKCAIFPYKNQIHCIHRWIQMINLLFLSNIEAVFQHVSQLRRALWRTRPRTIPRSLRNAFIKMRHWLGHKSSLVYNDLFSRDRCYQYIIERCNNDSTYEGRLAEYSFHTLLSSFLSQRELSIICYYFIKESKLCQ